jgi:hypothetical protein
MFTWNGDINGRSPASIAESVRRGFESVAAQIQTTWFKQHARDGVHTTVTADSVTIDGPLTLGRLSFRPNPFTYGSEGPRGIVVSPDIGGTTITTAWHFPYVDRAGVIVPDLSGGAATIYGLSVVNRQVGDVVALVNHQGYNTDLVLRLNPSGSFDGEFAGNLSTPNVDVTLPRGRWVWLMLLAFPGATALRWHVSHF